MFSLEYNFQCVLKLTNTIQGKNLVFQNNYCSGGHGISIGSISDAKTASGITISGNTVVKSMYGMRIKVKK